MINTKHLLKVSVVWISIVYTICYAGVAIYPPIRNLFMRYSLHADATVTTNYLGIGYFVSGLIIWNVVVLLGVWLFASLFNKIK
jgi:hypothetical protein